MNMKEDDTVSAVALVMESGDTAASVTGEPALADGDGSVEGLGAEGNGASPDGETPADE
jgi:hypothetical protein